MNRFQWHLSAAASVGGAMLAAVGCNGLLGGGYATAPEDAGHASQGDAGELDASVSDACIADPRTKPQLESACTAGTCAPFDNATRNPRCRAGGTECPSATPPDAGPPPAAGPPETGSDLDAGDAGAPPPDAGPGLPSCFSLTQGPAGGALPSPIVLAAGSTAIQPYVARVSQVLQSLGRGSVVYVGAGSCLGVDAMVNPQSGYRLQQIGATATYYDSALDASGRTQSGACVVDNPEAIADLGISDVFPTTCLPSLAAQGGLPNNLHDFFGPVQVMEMVVPTTSTQTTISAEAAYMVWGFGSASGVQPWTDDAFLLQRSASSGTQNMIAASIGLAPGAWRGVKNGGSGDVLAAIQNVKRGKRIDGGAGAPPDAAERTLGILASDFADLNRQDLKPLAFQDVGSKCGYFPDSTRQSFDKRNVRDGHYPIWGPTHLIAYADPRGNPINPAVDALIKAMNGASPDVLAALDIVQLYATSHIIPTCAMHVARRQDGGDYAPYHPPTPCSCYYELQATGQTDCLPCKTDADCKAAPNGATSCVASWGIPAVGYCEQPGE